MRDYAEDVPWRPSSFTGTARVERVVEAFGAGATIVLQALHVHHLPLARFCRALERELGHPAQANAYYTPRAAQGLPVHHDTHDVFVLQVSGEKRWLVYPPVLELPLRDQRYQPELGGPGATVLDATLRPGHTLYLPRGWLHEALTSESDSLHLTIGLNIYTWLDAAKAALEECGEEVDFRRGVPADGSAPRSLLGLLAARLQPEDVARRMRERFVRSRRPIRDDAFEQLRAMEALTLDSPLERRDTILSELRADGESVTLAFEGRTMRFPAHVRSELEFAATAEGGFRAADLPGRLDDESRLVLVRRLLREGFLRLSPEEP